LSSRGEPRHRKPVSRGMEYAIPLLMGAGAIALPILQRAVLIYRERRQRDNYHPHWYLGEFVPVETDVQQADRERLVALQSILHGNEGKI
jgi:hypothetical protein